MNGMMATPVSNNPVLEVELPFYTHKRFAAARTTKSWINKSTVIAPPIGAQSASKKAWSNWWNPWIEDISPNTDTVNRTPAFHQVHLTGVASQSLSGLLKSYVAAADDYSLSFYLGPPVLYNWKDCSLKTNSQYSLHSSLTMWAEEGVNRATSESSSI
jgi:hypothetical protein